MDDSYEDIPIDWLPVLTWPKFFYQQQRDFMLSDAWQTWMVSGNGTGKTLVIYTNAVMHMLGIHPKRPARPPLKLRVLVPSFDYVKDVALEKLQEPQRIEFPSLSKENQDWIDLLEKHGAIRDFKKPADGINGYLEVGPILPPGVVLNKGHYTDEHRGIELKASMGGSSLWFVTSIQGWQAQRGGEQDILLSDEEGDERVWDELKRGLRNAKIGRAHV